MKKITIIISTAIFFLAHDATAMAAKLPYAKGQSFVVTQGYDTPPTHVKKDSYALDFSQNGCDAYGKPVAATAPGTVMFLSQEGYNGGYGTELIIDHGGNIVSRYAHMIPGSITAPAVGVAIRQGQIVGRVGDTGLVAGAGCEEHPGTHLHFAMDTVNADGTFSAYDPEPISGYTDMTEGKWYVSDNDDGVTQGVVLGASVVATTSVVTTTSVATSSAPKVTIHPVPSMGGVTVISGPVNQVPSSPQLPPSLPSADATSTSTSSIASGTLFEQTDDAARSMPSWYDDNWFDLGNGFSGTLNTLTLEGLVSDPDYLASHISLQEFKDKNYTAMVQEFSLSDDAPFTHTVATATFAGLSIQLKPYFYYRLTTFQDYQNRSVILAGTATTTVGVTMWDNFVYGAGREESTSTFFPFMTMQGILATSTIVPLPLTVPGNLAGNFDQLNMQLNLSWSTSTDPDWPANPLHYQMNYSTSTSLSDAGWIDPGPVPLAAGESYLIGMRAVDNFGDVSAPATTTWSFPAGFVQYLLSPPLGYAYQDFTVASTSDVQSVQVFTTNIQTSARYVDSVQCSLQLLDGDALPPWGPIPSDNIVWGYDCAGAPTFSFASSLPTLRAGHRYRWVFTASTGNPSTGASVQFYGTPTDIVGGAFSDPSLANAKFVVAGDSGVLVSN